MTTRNRELASIIDASGNITTGGNLSVAGDLTQTSSSTTSYSDGLLELNSGAGSNSNDLGLVMERGSTGDNAIFLWDESNDGFAVGTTTAVGTATGNISFSAAPFTASTITGTVLTGSTSVKTPLIEYTDGDDAITIADGGHITTGGNLSIGGSNNELRFYEGVNYVGFEAPALSADKIWVLPAADGSANQILKTDGSGNLSFTDDLTLANASVNNFSGNGSATGFTLSTTPVSENATQAYINGVYQFKNTYSVSGTTFTFDTAPPNGSSIEVLVWSTVAVNVPATASVTNDSLNASIITAQSEVTAAQADHVLIYDASATALKKALVSDFGNTDEEIQDLIGAMFSSNTETGISVTYQDGDGTLDLVIGDDTIVSSMLDTNIDIAGTLDVTGVLTTDTNAVIAGTLGIAGSSTNGVAISQGAIAIKNGGAKSYIDLYCESSNAHYTRIEAAAHGAYSGNVTATLPVTTGTLAITSEIPTTEEIQDLVGAMFSSNTETNITVTYQDSDGTIDLVVDAGTTINNNANNRLITGSGTANTLEGESGLIFDGTNLLLGATSYNAGAFGSATGMNIKKPRPQLLLEDTDNNKDAYFGLTTAGVFLATQDALDIQFHTSDAERMRITSAGKVHIGNTFSADGSYDNLVVGTGAGNEGMTIYGAANGASSIAFADPNDNDVGNIMYDHSSNFMKFVTNTGERMRIDSSGSLGLGTNNPGSLLHVAHSNGGANPTARIENTAGTIATNSVLLDLKFSGDDSFSNCDYIKFQDSSGEEGVITGDGGGRVYYEINSDYRLKENITSYSGGLNIIKGLSVKRYNYIKSPDTNYTGFLAHEVAEVVDGVARGVKDATEVLSNVVLNHNSVVIAQGVTEAEWTDGKTSEKYASNTTWAASHTRNINQGLDLSKLVPDLVSAVQEQQTIIDDLKSRIETLEG